MYCLNLETSTKNLSLCLSQDGEIVRFRNIRTTHVLENSIIGAIDKILALAKISLKDVGAFGISLGPGSFTSLRVGLATVKALAFVGKQKIVGVCTLDIIARAVKEFDGDEICVVIDARRAMVYSALYTRNGELKGEYTLSSIDDVLKRVKGKTLFVGDAIGLYRQNIEDAYKGSKNSTCQVYFADQSSWLPQAKELAFIATERLSQGKVDDPMSIVPIYLYAQDCQVHK